MAEKKERTVTILLTLLAATALAADTIPWADSLSTTWVVRGGPSPITLTLTAGTTAVVQLELGYSRAGLYPVVIDTLTPARAQVQHRPSEDAWRVEHAYPDIPPYQRTLVHPARLLWNYARAWRVVRLDGNGTVQVDYAGMPPPPPPPVLNAPYRVRIRR